MYQNIFFESYTGSDDLRVNDDVICHPFKTPLIPLRLAYQQLGLSVTMHYTNSSAGKHQQSAELMFQNGLSVRNHPSFIS